MPNYHFNYYALAKLKIKKFYLGGIFILLCILGLLVYSALKKIDNTFICYGLIENNLLTIEINNELSDIIKENNKLIFNNQEWNYQVKSFGEYHLENQVVIEKVYLEITNLETTGEHLFYNNEIGIVKIPYKKEKLINYLLDLFK